MKNYEKAGLKMEVMNILLIEENIKDASLIEKHLTSIKELSIRLEHFTQLNEAGEYLLHNSASIILLVMNHSDVNELEKVRRTRKIAPSLPIVVLLKSPDKEFGLLAISVGADDYLLKDSLNHELTLRMFRYTIERKNGLEKANESEKKYEELVNLLPQTVFEMDVKGNLTFANDLAFQTFGYNKEEFTNNLTAFQMIEEKDRERALSNIHAVLRGKKTTDNEYSLLKKDGSTFPALIFSNPIVRNGETLGLRGIIIDITERKHAEESLKSSEEKFNCAFQSSPIAMAIQNSDDLFIDVNDAFLRMTEYGREEVIGYQGKELNLWADQEERNRAQDDYHLNGLLQDFEFSFRKKSGKIGVGIIWAEPIIIDGKTTVLTTALDITDRKLAEEALQKSEERFHRFFEKDLTGDFSSTTDGRILMCNNAFVKILKCKSKEEMLNKNSNDFYWEPQDRTSFLNELKEKKKITNIEITLKACDGSKVTVIENVLGIFDDTGELKEIAGYMLDITDRKKAEEEIKILAHAIESISESVSITDLNDKTLFVNNAFLKTYGYTKTELLDKPISKIRSSKSQPDITERILPETLKGGWKGELLNKKKDGTEFPVALSTSVIRDSNGNPEALVGVATDITDRKEAEEQILLLSRAVEKSPATIMITDEEGNIEYVNQKFIELTGYTLEEVKGKKPSILKSGYTTEDQYQELWNTIKSGNTWKGEFHNKKKNGELYWESALITPIQNDRLFLLAVKEDITEQKQLTEELILAKEKAEQSDKLKSEFLAQMSHEIRTPLNILLSFSTYIKEVLEEQQHLTEDLDQYFSATSAAGKRIIRTIEIILNMSDLKSGSFVNNPKPTDIYEEILKNVFHQLYRSADEKKLQFDLIQKSDSLFASIDQYAVEQVLIHIIDNAIKFTGKGHVLIYADKNQTGNAVIKIEDTGVGIGEEYMKRLYSPFTQEDHGYSRSFDGNGLGLALVKQYCELNNIQIDVLSEKMKGTIFTLTFPM